MYAYMYLLYVYIYVNNTYHIMSTVEKQSTNKSTTKKTNRNTHLAFVAKLNCGVKGQ